MPQDPALVAKARHAGLCAGRAHRLARALLASGGDAPGFGDGMVIGQHGSWNRSMLSGYRVVFVPFDNGSPAGAPRDILTGFLSEDESLPTGGRWASRSGRTGRCWSPTTWANVVWRVTGA